MDLVLLKPGDKSIVSAPEDGGSQIRGKLAPDFPDDALDGCIELLSYHHGLKQQMTTDVSNSARTSGRPELTDITCVKYYDKTSTVLYKYCLSATPLGKDKDYTRIYLCRNSSGGDDGGGVIANLMTIELENAMISSIESQSHPNDMATEQLTLNFTGIQWIYNAQLNNTDVKGKVVAYWSVAQNRAIELK